MKVWQEGMKGAYMTRSFGNGKNLGRTGDWRTPVSLILLLDSPHLLNSVAGSFEALVSFSYNLKRLSLATVLPWQLWDFWGPLS